VISTDSPLDHVTPYDRFTWSDEEIERALVSGAQRRELSAYFGAREYRALTALAQRAQRARIADPALRVFVVPGIMGSQLGLLRPAPLPHDIVWIDPIDIELGRLAALRLPGPARIVPLGVVLFSYLRLKLYLRAHGFAVEFYDYDWRLPVADVGRAFAERLRGVGAARAAIVAHSMGGLVSRTALAMPGSGCVERVILLGTPNFGSFAAVQALRGTYVVVRKVARLTANASAEELATEVFNTFPSLYDLLPSGPSAGTADFFDPHVWPASGPRPRSELLETARLSAEQLAPPDERFAVIVGVGAQTVTAVRRRRDDFVYTLTRNGDGTVPAASAALRGVQSAYAPVAHSDLTRDPVVAGAVVDLLRRGRTRRLPGKWTSGSRACAQVSDSELRRGYRSKVDWAALSAEERRLFLENLNIPVPLRLHVPQRARAKLRHAQR